MSRISRRHLLRVGVPAFLALAGCAETQPAPATESTMSTATGTSDPSGSATTTDAKGTTTPLPDFDLREANVVAVAVERQSDAYRFDVTLIHNDDGEEGYANWWQVETLDGQQLGRRDLLHAHGTRKFTRSETVEIPDGTTCVVVRGHDQTHGYGGQAMLVNLETGATRAVRQGSEKASVADATCP